MEKNKAYEVEYVRELASGRCTIDSEYFDTFEEARDFSDVVCDNVHVIRCIIWRNGIRVLDVL